MGNATGELTHGLEPLRAAERLFEIGFARLLVDLIVDVGDRAQEPRRLVGVADVERRKTEANVTIRAVPVTQPQGGLADLLRLQITHARPVRIGFVSILEVDEGVQTVGRGHVLERGAEEVGSVEHLTASVAAVEQDDDIGRAPQDRSEALLRRAARPRRRELLLEGLVEKAVLIAEMPDRGITAREHEAGGQRERGQGATHEENEIGERHAQQSRRRTLRADEKSETAPTERHRLIPRDQTGERSGATEHDPRVRARGDQRVGTTGRRGRGERDLEIDRRVSVRGAGGEPEIERRSTLPECQERRARGRTECGAPAVDQEMGITDPGNDAWPAGVTSDERHAGQRLAQSDVPTEHGREPMRVGTARRDDPVRRGEDLIDRRHEVLYAEERFARRPIDSLPVQPIDVAANDEEDARRRDHTDERDHGAPASDMHAE